MRDLLMKYAVSFSGGKDSTYMLFKLLELGRPVDYVVFSDTGVLFPEVYQHIELVAERLRREWGLELITVRAPHTFLEYVTKYKRPSGKWKGYPYFFPTPRNRWCTKVLKLDPLTRWKKEVGEEVIFYIGITRDEPSRRVKDRGKGKEYPLLGVSSVDTMRWCQSQGFTWSGLYEKVSRGNCFTCPFRRAGEIFYLIRHRPELWSLIREAERHLYRLGVPRWRFTSSRSCQQWEQEYEWWSRWGLIS